jgi:hypothetical protein
MLLFVFVQELVSSIPHIMSGGSEEVILTVLTLIDLSLAGNLVLIVIFSGYENFVSKIDVQGHEDRPSWMGTLDFSGLKIKLIASIVAISAISLLRAFHDADAAKRSRREENLLARRASPDLRHLGRALRHDGLDRVLVRCASRASPQRVAEGQLRGAEKLSPCFRT